MWKAVAFRGAVDRGDLEEVNDTWQKGGAHRRHDL